MVRQHIAGRVLLACAAGTLFCGLVLWRAGENPDRFSLIFWQLLFAYDGHATGLLLVLAVAAYLLRGQPLALALVPLAARNPWPFAGALFVLLCAGALRVYHAHPLAMDEYSPLFQAQAFAAGRLDGNFPPDLIDWLIPSFFQGYFLTPSRAIGDVASSYWPGFALLVAPFAAIGAPWAANPAIGALSVPLVHRLAKRVAGSDEAAGWAVLFCVASPVFIVSSLSYYSMPAHLLCNLVFTLLILEPTVRRATLAGVVGSLALTLHNPVPHLLFLLPALVWLCRQPRPLPMIAALLAGYLPLGVLLGLGWQQHLAALRHVASTAAAAAGPSEAPSLVQMFLAQVSSLVTIPDMRVVQARLAGLSKIWTWGAAGLLIFAAWGAWIARREPGVRLLAAAFLVTFFGYFLVPFDQGHGWGYRYIHSAWFSLPVLAALLLVRIEDGELRAMGAWGIVLSLVLANALRLVQVEGFVAHHLEQVPPLTRAVEREIIFIDLSKGLYTQDLVQNDPFLRSPRVIMVYRDAGTIARFMAQRFPSYYKRESGRGGERWSARVN